MKIARHFYFTCFILLTVTLILESCKKGDDDPFLSFRSRTNRLTGTWNNVRTTVNGEEVNQSGDRTIEFRKDGYGTETIKLSGASIINDLRWSFVSKSSDYKNKERIVIYNKTKPGGSVYDILELRNDKLVLEFRNDNDYTRLYYEQ